MSEIIGQYLKTMKTSKPIYLVNTLSLQMLWCSDDNENIFEGNIVFERISTNEFGVNILTSNGKTLDGDYSFGAYFTCYDGYEGTPGGSLRLVVDENGLSISGSSQWERHLILILLYMMHKILKFIGQIHPVNLQEV